MKINSKLAEGELGRLISSQLIHGDIIHYAVNTRSMMVVGPQVQKLTFKILFTFLSLDVLNIPLFPGRESVWAAKDAWHLFRFWCIG